MKKTLIIIRRELLVRIRKPAFWVLTLLVPLVLAALYALPVVAASRAVEPVTVMVVDQTGLFEGGLRSTDAVHFKAMPSVEYAERERADGDLILFVPLRETALPREATLLYHGLRPPSLVVQSTVDNQLQQLLRNAILEDVYGLSPAERHSVESSHIALHTRDAVTGREGLTRIKTVAAAVLALLMALALVMFGVQVMRAVQEERQNRIAEVMATSVRPVQILGGKIAGVTIAALIQMMLWALLTAAAFAAVQAAAPDLFQAAVAGPHAFDTRDIASNDMAIGAQQSALVGDTLRGLAAIDLPLIAAVFILCFMLGFLLYGGLLSALAARLDSEADALQWSLLLCSPLLLVPLLMPLVVGGATWLLLVPFTAPAALVASLPFGVGWTTVALSLLLLAAAAVMALLLAAKSHTAGTRRF